jgi:hypothetical protein
MSVTRPNSLEEEATTYHDFGERIESMDQKALYKVCRTGRQFSHLHAYSLHPWNEVRANSDSLATEGKIRSGAISGTIPAM